MGSRYSMTLKRDAKSGAFKDRIRLPEDVRLEYQALHGPAWEEKFHRPADTPSDKALAEHAAWAAKVKGRIAALRSSKAGKGVDLTQKQAAALAGDWYREFTSQHEDNPGSPNGYDWRHSFRTRAARPGVGIEERMRGAICGHAPQGSGQGYEHPTVEDMAEALKLFPRYQVE
jgi:integrase